MLTVLHAALLLAPTADPEPPTRLRAPAVTFIGLRDGALVFEVSNPNKQPLPYVGYVPDVSGVEKGQIAPIFKVELQQGRAWKAQPLEWCPTGKGPVKLPGRAKATFTVPAPAGAWGAVRVGVTWYATPDRKGPATAWSAAVTRRAATPPKAP